MAGDKTLTNLMKKFIGTLPHVVIKFSLGWLFRKLYMLTKKFKRVISLDRCRSEKIAICSNVYCKSLGTPAKISKHATAARPLISAAFVFCLKFNKM